MAKVIGVKFKNSGKSYFFDPLDFDVHKDDHVIVETGKGIDYGFVVSDIREIAEEKLFQPLKPILRKANERDEAQVAENHEKEKEAFRICQEKVREHNLDMKIATDRAKASAIIANAENSGEKSAFLTALSKGFGTAFVQKTQNASSNLLSVGANYIIEAMKGDSKKWYNAAKSHCTLSRKLKSESTIKDFYSAPSSLGAMDPQNIQFKGFGCHHYLEEVGNANHGEEVFYVFCSMLRDSAGISSIVNHSKFMVEVDSLMFNPKYCGLPNDSLETITPFDFSKRKNLTLTIKARIYSSWINEAILVTNDQQLGEFTITARIDPTVLNGDSVFVYKKNDPRFQKLVNVTGDCFIIYRHQRWNLLFKHMGHRTISHRDGCQ